MSRPAERVRDFLGDADSAGSIAATLRARRWSIFLELFPDLSDMRVIDLGGTANYWKAAPVRPAHVLVVNLEAQPVEDASWMSSVVGDVCELAPELADQRFDLVYSNSVIEHVGGHARRLDMVDNIHRLGDRHWIQTPYRYFPIEPHWFFPGFQFLSPWLATKVGMHWPLLWSKSPDERTATSKALSVELLDRTQFGFYFPDSRVIDERVSVLTKSLIATR